MQGIFFDLPAQNHGPKLQQWEEQGLLQRRETRTNGYERFWIQAESVQELQTILETIFWEQCVQWVISQRRPQLDAEENMRLQQKIRQRMHRAEPQLRQWIAEDITSLLNGNGQINLSGYFRFGARRIKAVLRQILRQEYAHLEQELEQEEFIALLKFFVETQPSLLDCVFLTMNANQFVLLDEWGNDLRKWYEISLREEDLEDVCENDLLMSILITFLPKKIYFEIQETSPSREFLTLLQTVFIDRLVWQ